MVYGGLSGIVCKMPPGRILCAVLDNRIRKRLPNHSIVSGVLSGIL